MISLLTAQLGIPSKLSDFAATPKPPRLANSREAMRNGCIFEDSVLLTCTEAPGDVEIQGLSRRQPLDNNESRNKAKTLGRRTI